MMRGSFNSVSSDDGDGRWICDSPLCTVSSRIWQVLRRPVETTRAKRKLCAPVEFFSICCAHARGQHDCYADPVGASQMVEKRHNGGLSGKAVIRL
jgi:hypothetical protein